VGVAAWIPIWILLHLFYLFLCQYSANFIAMALQHSLRLGIVIPPVLLFLLTITLVLLVFYASK
jgi:hypothetical protein